MVSAVTVTVSTYDWRLAKKQLVQRPPTFPNHSTRVGFQIPDITCYLLKPRNLEARGHHREASEVTAIEEDASTRAKKVFVKGETGGKANTWYHSQPVCGSKLDRLAVQSIDRRFYPTKRLPAVRDVSPAR